MIIRTTTPNPCESAPRSSRPHPPGPSVAPAAAVGWLGHDILGERATAAVLHAVWSGDPAVVVPSPPGSGKTRLVTLLAAALAHRAGLRVAVAAQTREQAAEITRRLALLGSDRLALIWKKRTPPPATAGAPVVYDNVRWARDLSILVATTARWLVSDPASLRADVLIVDEAYQCTYARLGALSALARQVVCVGDPGQIAPVVTGDPARWITSKTGPHLPAPAALLAAHGGEIGVVRLDHSWRLGPVTTALVQPMFYSRLPFTSRRPDEYLTTAGGSRLDELAHRLISPTGGHCDPAVIAACADRARDLLATALTTPTGTRPLETTDLSVVVPHVAQAAALRAHLASHPGVLIGTADSLQGLERPAVVVLHPLAGYRAAEPFGLDLGRLSVMLTRHRAHATVVLDSATQTVLGAADPDPATETSMALLDALRSTPAV
jgi:hypothetical protein